MACDMIAEGMMTREDGRPGCLQGQKDEYLNSLDDLVAKKDAAFASNREALLKKIEAGNQATASTVSEIEKHLNDAKKKLAKLYNPP